MLANSPNIPTRPPTHPINHPIQLPIHITSTHNIRPEQINNPHECLRDPVRLVLDVLEEQELSAWLQQCLDNGHGGGQLVLGC